MSNRHMQEDMTMNMKVLNSSKMIGYWTTTIIVTIELIAGGVTDLIHGPELLFVGDPVATVLAHLGYPVYLLTILGVWKLLGAIALLVPRFPRLKEWAYAGTFFIYIMAAASWASCGGGVGNLIGPLVFAMLTL
ncbi:MAG TPA: DoxX family protein, partial [Ktedonobacteraceae bacterium]|nr:DoxX family protein [Ktedonobacteraceae bacterium]